MTTITVESEVCINDYLDRLTNAELMVELQRRKDNGTWTKSADSEACGPILSFCYEAEPLAIYEDEIEAIKEAIKTKGDDAAMVLVKEIICRELGCIL